MCCAGGTCDSGESHENDVILYAKIEGRREHIPLDTLTYAAYKVNCLKQSRWMGMDRSFSFQAITGILCGEFHRDTQTWPSQTRKSCAGLGAVGTFAAQLCSSWWSLQPQAGLCRVGWGWGKRQESSGQRLSVISWKLQWEPLTNKDYSSLFPLKLVLGTVWCWGAGSWEGRSWWDQGLGEGLQWWGHRLSHGGSCWQSAQAASPLPKVQLPSSHIHHPQQDSKDLEFASRILPV